MWKRLLDPEGLLTPSCNLYQSIAACSPALANVDFAVGACHETILLSPPRHTATLITHADLLHAALCGADGYGPCDRGWGDWEWALAR